MMALFAAYYYRLAKSVQFMAWSGLQSQLEAAGVIRNGKLLTDRNPLSDTGRPEITHTCKQTHTHTHTRIGRGWLQAY